MSDCVVWLKIAAMLLHVVCNASAANTNVVWYTTAQGTPDILSRQPDLKFEADFSSPALVSINRYTLQNPRVLSV